MAYEMTTLTGEGGGVDDHEYEVIGRGRGNTHTGDEGLYEISSSVTQYPGGGGGGGGGGGVMRMLCCVIDHSQMCRLFDAYITTMCLTRLDYNHC